MNETRTYIDREWYIRRQDNLEHDGAWVLEHDKSQGFFMPEDHLDGHTAARYVSGRAMEVVMACDHFCKQWPDGPQVDAAQPDPRVKTLSMALQNLLYRVDCVLSHHLTGIGIGDLRDMANESRKIIDSSDFETPLKQPDPRVDELSRRNAILQVELDQQRTMVEHQENQLADRNERIDQLERKIAKLKEALKACRDRLLCNPGHLVQMGLNQGAIDMADAALKD